MTELAAKVAVAKEVQEAAQRHSERTMLRVLALVDVFVTRNQVRQEMIDLLEAYGESRANLALADRLVRLMETP